MPKFDQVTIAGLGLIGGSLGMALRRRRAAKRIVGLSRSRDTIRKALARRAIHAGTTDARAAVRDADLVVIAAPVDLIVPMAGRLARMMRPGAVITDVGSTKAAIVAALRRLPNRVAFVGSHPIAGSEQRGLAAASPTLFDKASCVVTPAPGTSPAALRKVRALWEAAGLRVVAMSPAAHDRLLAAGSHLPHLVAFSLAASLDPTSLSIVPRSLLDMTRVAKSDAELWDDIFISNRDAVLTAASRYARAFAALLQPVAAGSRPRLRRLLARAQRHRHALERR
jgi:prephenate dehydrogenase